jgi:diaminopimelate dehydrogenase
MRKPIHVAVVGCGHIGAPAVRAIQLAPDMILTGVVDLDCRLSEIQEMYPEVPVGTDLAELPEKPDVTILAVPTRAVERAAPAILAQGICTIDCFDMHGEPFLHLRSTLDPIARQHHVTSILCSGVDPGVSTMVRALFEIWAPTGLTYVRYGPGMSMGHTVAAKSYAGVRDALSITRPGDPGCHKRELYLELEEGADFEIVKSQLMRDPYFAHDDVRVIQVDDVSPLVDVGHRIEVFRKGG